VEYGSTGRGVAMGAMGKEMEVLEVMQVMGLGDMRCSRRSFHGAGWQQRCGGLAMPMWLQADSQFISFLYGPQFFLRVTPPPPPPGAVRAFRGDWCPRFGGKECDPL
jgi:hypothetical protein